MGNKKEKCKAEKHCRWDSDKNKCEADDIPEQLPCKKTKTKEDCKAREKHCHWEAGECEEGRECKEIGGENKKEKCKAETHCRWDSDKNKCEADDMPEQLPCKKTKTKEDCKAREKHCHWYAGREGEV